MSRTGYRIHKYECIKPCNAQYGQSQSEKRNACQLLLPQRQSTYPRGPESASIEISLSDPNLLNKKQFLKML